MAGYCKMISPFDTIDYAIEFLEKLMFEYDIFKETEEYEKYDKSKEPEWFKRLIEKNNLELVKKFKECGHKTAASWYAEVIIGATPSKGCKVCGFYYKPSQSLANKKRCNLTGHCRPLRGI